MTENYKNENYEGENYDVTVYISFYTEFQITKLL